MENNLDFNFGSSGSIFGDFTPDLSSLQAKPDETEETPEIKDEDKKVNPIEEELEEEETTTGSEDEDNQENEDGIDQEEDQGLENELESDNEDETDVSNVSYKAIADYLAESGIVDSLDDYEGEDSPEALEAAVQKTINNMVDHYKNSIPEEGKHFLNYLEKGGDPSKYFQSLEKPIDFETVDLTDEKNQKRLYEEYLKTLSWTPEEIQEELQDAEDNLLLEKKSKIAKNKLEKIYQEKKERLVAEQEQLLLEQQKAYDEYIGQIKNTIKTSNNLAGLTLTPSEKSEFEKYLLQKDGEGLTKYERELQDNPIQTQLELAYLKFKKYDFSKVANKVKTEETRRIRNLIKNTDKSNGKSPQVKKTEAGDLSAFKTSLF